MSYDIFFVSFVFVGHLCPDAAAKVGSTGRFSVVDVTPNQVEHAKSKLQQCPWATVRTGDASEFSSILPDGETPYDAVYAFMLLHEIPDKMKYQVVDNMLKSVKKGGTVLWYDNSHCCCLLQRCVLVILVLLNSTIIAKNVRLSGLT